MWKEKKKRVQNKIEAVIRGKRNMKEVIIKQ